MSPNQDDIGELAKALLTDRPFMEIYAKIERLFYGLGPGSLAHLMQDIACRMRESARAEAPSRNPTELYDSGFFRWVRLGSLRSSQAIVPLLVDLIHPHSVVDVGCGDGTWLSTFMQLGVTKVLGVDGPWVKSEDLIIPRHLFRAVDLQTFRPREDEEFDLVLSVECAEHLEEEHAGPFVRALCSLGPVVCFSAAIPFQGGAGHVNEQWPDYWARIFEDNGYRAIDCIRPRIWVNPEVESWYAQNTLLFANEVALEHNPVLSEFRNQADYGFLPMVHPTQYLKIVMFLLPELVRQGMY